MMKEKVVQIFDSVTTVDDILHILKTHKVLPKDAIIFTETVEDTEKTELFLSLLIEE